MMGNQTELNEHQIDLNLLQNPLKLEKIEELSLFLS